MQACNVSTSDSVKTTFHTIKEWWNTGEYDYASPSDHLFSLMGVRATTPEGIYHFGKGSLTVLRHDPKEYAMSESGEIMLMDESVSDDPSLPVYSRKEVLLIRLQGTFRDNQCYTNSPSVISCQCGG